MHLLADSDEAVLAGKSLGDLISFICVSVILFYMGRHGAYFLS